MSFYKSFYWVSMSICLDEICLIKKFLMLRFGLVRLVKWKPHTKPNNALSKKMIRLHPNQMRFFAVLVWVGSVCGVSIWLVWFWTPLVAGAPVWCCAGCWNIWCLWEVIFPSCSIGIYFSSALMWWRMLERPMCMGTNVSCL